jgi:hypothetical protein
MLHNVIPTTHRKLTNSLTRVFDDVSGRAISTNFADDRQGQILAVTPSGRLPEQSIRIAKGFVAVSTASLIHAQLH